jgi:ectoine hydroxylase-related dioxygenase (phytanoyl-CoA dioxygenase family)
MKKKSLNIKSIKKEISENGYCVLKNFIKKKEIKKILETLVLVFAKEVKNHNINYKKIKKKNYWQDFEFNKKIIKLRKNKPSKFSIVYNLIKNNPNFVDIVNNKNLIDLASNLLNTDISNIWNGEFTLRMDPPKDKRNLLGWHQEANYYKQHTRDGINGLVFTITFSEKINNKNGGLQVCPKSQKLGLLNSTRKKVKLKKYKGKYSSETHQVDNLHIKKFKPKTIVTHQGDLVIMDLKLFHRSGYNSSKLFRITSINRVFNTLSSSHPLA